jgi:hypothetical protein
MGGETGIRRALEGPRVVNVALGDWCPLIELQVGRKAVSASLEGGGRAERHMKYVFGPLRLKAAAQAPEPNVGGRLDGFSGCDALRTFQDSIIQGLDTHHAGSRGAIEL